ncbi:hypothetical protein F7725_009673 [Dissostichus mawsoni]|uniref:Uncharacterized protein n=1 Tax=Dissostichus mawsoni TaxID=36200 RepID=A0A7J5XLD6_DISMA|nr:hypothetical protein F7725_009673 [Dissostichus mawsoni]
MHTQMYMLEGSSRWNMNRAHAAVGLHVSGASQTRIYDVRLKSERIAVEYLLAQSDRGDLLGPQQHSELGTILSDRQVEVQEEECLDITISDAVEILSQRPSEVDTSAPHGAFLLPVSHNTSPHTSSQSLALSPQSDAAESPPEEPRPESTQSISLPADSPDASTYTTSQAALRPDASRICECVSLRLLKEFELARNRPKDSKVYGEIIRPHITTAGRQPRHTGADQLGSCYYKQHHCVLLAPLLLHHRTRKVTFHKPVSCILAVPHASSTNSCLMAVPHASSTNSCLMAVPMPPALTPASWQFPSLQAFLLLHRTHRVTFTCSVYCFILTRTGSPSTSPIS